MFERRGGEKWETFRGVARFGHRSRDRARTPAKYLRPVLPTKAVGQGTGLGLPISRRIVEEHDGWIEAANGAEGGAVFTAYLSQTSRTETRAAEPEVEEGIIA